MASPGTASRSRRSDASRFAPGRRPRDLRAPAPHRPRSVRRDLHAHIAPRRFRIGALRLGFRQHRPRRGLVQLRQAHPQFGCGPAGFSYTRAVTAMPASAGPDALAMSFTAPLNLAAHAAPNRGSGVNPGGLSVEAALNCRWKPASAVSTNPARPPWAMASASGGSGRRLFPPGLDWADKNLRHPALRTPGRQADRHPTGENGTSPKRHAPRANPIALPPVVVRPNSSARPRRRSRRCAVHHATSALAPAHRAAHTKARATAPGTACTQRIFRFAVAPPKIPATITQPRKKTFCG